MPQPCRADSPAEFKLPTIVTQRIDGPDDLMSRHQRQSLLGQVAFDNMQIRSTDGAAVDLDANLPRHRLGNRPLDEFQRRGVDGCDFFQ
jgi:hypothetical protein